MALTAARILKKLKQVAPHVAIRTEWSEDPYFRWDGDGPDPAEEGFVAYDVDVYARTIIDGEVLEGRDSLGGVYAQPGEGDPDISGYFMDMVYRALDELLSLGHRVVGPAAPKELDREIARAKDVMLRARQIRQMEQAERQVRKQDWSPRRKKPRRHKL